MPESLLAGHFSTLDLAMALQVVFLGFIGGTLSGFIGSGGAFFMTPGMMNLGVPGAVAVASNISHKFGKAMIGSRKHSELGHVDKKLAVFVLITAALGINLAVFVMKSLFSHGQEEAAEGASALSDLYISVVFVGVLSLVSISMLADIVKSRKEVSAKPSRRIVDFLNRFRLPPIIRFPVADVSVSLWVILVCGLATGYLAGTIGVGGFIGVPAMIYVFGTSAQVAAGTELFLAMFMGAYGLLNYAYQGMVDVRLVLLLYLGSLLGIHLGTYGTKVVRELIIRLVTCCIILLCVLSRLAAVPVYLRKLDYVEFDSSFDDYFLKTSKVLLYASGVIGAILILFFVFRAYRERRRVQASLIAPGAP